MKDMGEASYVIGIEIFRDRKSVILGLSQTAYINKILKIFQMDNSNPQTVPIQKGDSFSEQKQCPRTESEKEQMKDIPYASIVESLMYAQTCTRPDISFAVDMLGRYQRKNGLVGSRWLHRFGFRKMLRHKEVYWRLHLSFSGRSNIMEKLQADDHCRVYYGS